MALSEPEPSEHASPEAESEVARSLPNPSILALTVGSTIGFLGLAALGWGGWNPLVFDPARAWACGVVGVAAFASLFTGINLGGCVRADSRGWWILFPVAGTILAFAWLASYADRRGLGTIGGEAIRHVGLGLLAIGGALRVGPMFLLGPRFTWPLASQTGHRLLTSGLYRRIRHPSYAGGLLGMAGWSLVFRSGIGLGLTLLVIPAIVSVIREEEELLMVEHGAAYAEYRRRTWRLLPFVY